jgi:FkbM family methyltransferase
MNKRTLDRASRLAHLISRVGAKRVLSVLKLLPAGQRADAVDLLLSKPVVVDTPHGPIRFLGHSGVSYWRARTIMTKEPESLKWIDAMVPGSVFWDIGANVGMLTLYAAMRGDLEVWAFEPAAVNYYNLVANCELNRLEKRVRCLQLGFSDVSGIADLHVSQLMSAHSFTFRESKKLDARRKTFPSIQAVQIFTIDDFIARHDAPHPNYIKIDVPGLTPEIFAGARQTLANPALRQIQVEAREHKGGRRIAELLAPLGFKLLSRGMRCDGKLQRDLVFARDILGFSNVTAPASGASNQVGFRRGAAEPSR